VKEEGGKPQRERDPAGGSQVAEDHEAKRKRAEKRGQKRKRKGNKVLGGPDEDREMPVVNRYRGAEDHTRRKGPVHSPRNVPFLYNQKKHPSE